MQIKENNESKWLKMYVTEWDNNIEEWNFWGRQNSGNIFFFLACENKPWNFNFQFALRNHKKNSNLNSDFRESFVLANRQIEAAFHFISPIIKSYAQPRLLLRIGENLFKQWFEIKVKHFLIKNIFIMFFFSWDLLLIVNNTLTYLLYII